MVPHLVTALNGPINELEARMLDSVPAIERWFRLELGSIKFQVGTLNFL